MARSKPICAALVLTSLALAVLSPRPATPSHVVMWGPLDDAQLRAWQARSDWSRAPAPGEPVEWRGERWMVVAAGGESLRVRPPHGNDAFDRVVPVGEVRLIGLSRALPSGEVIAYRLHAVREAE